MKLSFTYVEKCVDFSKFMKLCGGGHNKQPIEISFGDGMSSDAR
jgi:hypothetical protein